MGVTGDLRFHWLLLDSGSLRFSPVCTTLHAATKVEILSSRNIELTAVPFGQRVLGSAAQGVLFVLGGCFVLYVCLLALFFCPGCLTVGFLSLRSAAS